MSSTHYHLSNSILVYPPIRSVLYWLRVIQANDIQENLIGTGGTHGKKVLSTEIHHRNGTRSSLRDYEPPYALIKGHDNAIFECLYCLVSNGRSARA